MKAISIRDRLIMWTLIYSVLLTNGLLIFFGISGERNLENRAREEIETKLIGFETALNHELDNANLELNALFSRLSGLSDPTFIVGNKDTLQYTILYDFFYNYPYKYDALQWENTKHGIRYQARPIREFDALDVVIEPCKRPLLLMQKPDLTLGHFGPVLRLSPKRQRTDGRLIGQVHLNRILNTVVNQVDLSGRAWSYFITDSTRLVIHTERTEFINRPLPEILKKHKHTMRLSRSLNTAGLTLVVEKNWDRELLEWRSKLKQGLIFSILLIIVAVSISGIIGQKISSSIQAVSEKALQVAEGQFDASLPSSRRDELGGLFRAFNQMTVRLKESYSLLKQMNDELETHLRELQSARQELSRKQRLALLGEAISKISHEIQNKIGGVSIWVQNLERAIPDDENLKLHVEELKKALAALMDRLIHFKRFYREPELQLTSTQFRQWLPTAIETLAQTFQNKKLTLAFDWAKDLPSLAVDQNQMQDAMENLLLNAAYYAPVGSTVTVKTDADDSCLILSVKDQGPGTTHDSDELFQPFFTTKTSGSGLGLAIVQKIVLAHGGEISCSNPPEGGALFTIRLPVAESKQSD